MRKPMINSMEDIRIHPTYWEAIYHDDPESAAILDVLIEEALIALGGEGTPDQIFAEVLKVMKHVGIPENFFEELIDYDA